MIPRSLMLRNFMCYREPPAPLRFEGLHIACLCGDNGAGKSALLDAITWALWGKARLESDELIAQTESEMLVEFDFLLNGLNYRVRRSRQRGKGSGAGKSMLDFQVATLEGNWRVLSEGTMRETQTRINETLRMEYDTFINASFLLQGRADEFTRKPPADRKRVLAEILGLSIYDQLEERAKARVKKASGQIQELRGRIESLNTQAEKRETYARLVEHAREQVQTAQTQLALLSATEQSAQQLLQRLEQASQQRGEWQQRADKVRSEHDDLLREQARLQAAIRAAEQLLAQRETILAGTQQLAGAQAQLADVEQRFEPYQQLSLQQQKAQQELQRMRDKLIGQRDRAAEDLRAVHTQLEPQARLEAELAQQQQALASIDLLRNELDTLEQALEQLGQRQQAINELELARRELQAKIQAAEQNLDARITLQRERLSQLLRGLGDEGRLRGELQAAEAASQQLAPARSELAERRLTEQHLAERVGQLRAESQRLETEGKRVSRQLDLLQAGEHTCPTCGAELDAGGAEQVLLRYQTERDQLRSAYQQVKREIKQLEQQLQTLRAVIEQLEQQLRGLEALAAQVSDLNVRVAGLDQLRREQQQCQQELEDLQAQRSSGAAVVDLRARLQQCDAELALLAPAQLQPERQALSKRKGQLQRQLQGRDDLIAAISQLQSGLAQIAQASAELPVAEQRLAELQARLDTERFGSELRAELAELHASIEQLAYSPERHSLLRREVQSLQHWEQQARQLAQAEYELGRLRQDVERLATQIARRLAELTAAQEQVAALSTELRQLPQAREELQAARARLQEQQLSLSRANTTLGEHQALLKSAEEAAQELAAAQQVQRGVEEQRALYDELAEACGKKGVQAMLIETAIPEIEREANLLLGRITDSQMHVTFETQRDTKKGDTVETLEIKIADTVGTRDYLSFSGGEAFRVNFAVRVALSRLLARRAGASLETLVVDEGFGALDAVGRERIVEAISSVQHDFRHILVITHLQELKDMFPAQIEIARSANGSVWSVS